MPAFTLINGGSNAGNKLAFKVHEAYILLPIETLFFIKELKILPTGATSFAEAMRMGSEVYRHLKAEIKKRLV